MNIKKFLLALAFLVLSVALFFRKQILYFLDKNIFSKTLEQKLIDNPNNPFLNYKIAKNFYTKSAYPKAEKFFKKAAENFSNEFHKQQKALSLGFAGNSRFKLVKYFMSDKAKKKLEPGKIIDFLEKAVKHYSASLSFNSDDLAVVKNKQLAEELLKKLKQDQENNKNQDNQNKDSQQNSPQQQGGSASQDSSDQNKNDKNDQSNNKNNKDQNQKDQGKEPSSEQKSNNDSSGQQSDNSQNENEQKENQNSSSQDHQNDLNKESNPDKRDESDGKDRDDKKNSDEQRSGQENSNENSQEKHDEGSAESKAEQEKNAAEEEDKELDNLVAGEEAPQDASSQDNDQKDSNASLNRLKSTNLDAEFKRLDDAEASYAKERFMQRTKDRHNNSWNKNRW